LYVVSFGEPFVFDPELKRLGERQEQIYPGSGQASVEA